MSHLLSLENFRESESLKSIFAAADARQAEIEKNKKYEELKALKCACGAPAVCYLKKSGRPYCTLKKNGCPLTQAINKKRIAEKTIIGRLRTAIYNGGEVCYICGEVAKYIVTIKGKLHPCCSRATKACPKWSEKNHARILQWYNDNPDMREWHRENCKKINNRPEVKRAKSSAMIRLHNQDETFKARYKKGYENRAVDKIKSPENRKRQSDMMKEKYQDPEFRKKRCKGLMKEFNILEERFYDFLNGLYPSVFRYNFKGIDMVKGPGRYQPDFVNIKHQIAIDIDGEAHLRKDLRDQTSDALRTVKYSQIGWYHLSVSYRELDYPNELAKKIINFIRGAGFGKKLIPTYYPE